MLKVTKLASSRAKTLIQSIGLHELYSFWQESGCLTQTRDLVNS